MFNTVNTKRAQLERGYFKIGTGKTNILIIGSCRSVPYINYLYKWNTENGDVYSISFIDPFNWNYDLNDNRTDFEKVITLLEKDERILALLNSTDVCVHEYYRNFGMFNFDKTCEKNIYQFGFTPIIDVCIPSFNDIFILAGDIVTFDTEIRKKAIQDFNVTGQLSAQTQKEIFDLSQRNINKFYEVCRKSDIPEMEEYFKDNLQRKRLFWSYNHISTAFSWFIFACLCKRYLSISLENIFLQQIYAMPDMFANNYTHLTEYDVAFYGFDWGEEIKLLRERL